jgi:hypothetical protein
MIGSSLHGFGMRREKIEKRLATAERAQALAAPDGVAALVKQEETGRGRTVDNVKSYGGGNSDAYLVSRLKRDVPHVASAATGDLRLRELRPGLTSCEAAQQDFTPKRMT